MTGKTPPADGTAPPDIAAALKALQDALPGDALVTDPDECARAAQGARYGDGKAAFMVRPATTAQLVSATRICRAHAVPVLPQGANTGLVGDSTPDASGTQAIVSLERLTEVFRVDLPNRSVTVSAGFRLSELNRRLAPHGLTFPIDLGADPSIGGMIATNTGGSRFIRYGDVRANLLALKLLPVNGQSDLLELSSAVRKDNSGLALKHLVAGSGHRLGIVTEATLNLEYLPSQSATAMIAPAAEATLIDLVGALERRYGHLLTAVEAISAPAFDLAKAHLPELASPFHPKTFPPLALLVELSSSLGAEDLNLQSCLETGLADMYEKGLIENGVMGRGNDFWAVRHALTEGARAAGYVIGFDISVPRGAITEFRRRAKGLVELGLPGAIVADFGHIGDGGLHFNVICPFERPAERDQETIKSLRREIYDLVVLEFHGSFSAEHGIGPSNMEYYHSYKAEPVKRLEKDITRLISQEYPFT